MNRRLSFCLVTLLGSGCFLQSAYGQTPAPAPAAVPASAPAAATLPPALKIDRTQAPDVATQQQMSQWVTANLAILASGSPADQAKVRDVLIEAMPKLGANGVVPAYIDGYARALDDALVIALKANPPLRQRLVLAVIAAKAAERAEDASTPLSDTAEVLLQDSSEAVVLWGMKTAKYVLPGKLTLGANAYNGLLNRIVPVGSKYPGPVLEEAYQALTLWPMKLKSQPAELAKPPVIARVKIVLPHVQALLAKRVADWAGGTLKSPIVEAEATGFLTIPGVWPIQTPVQQRQTLTLTHEALVKATAAFANAVQPSKEREELCDLIKYLCGAMITMADLQKDAVLKEAAGDLKKITPPTGNAVVAGWMASLTNAFNATPIIKASPAGTAGGPTTQSSATPVGQAAVTK